MWFLAKITLSILAFKVEVLFISSVGIDLTRIEFEPNDTLSLVLYQLFRNLDLCPWKPHQVIS